MKLRSLLASIAGAAALALPIAAGADTVAPSVTINGWTPSLTALHCTQDAATGAETCASSPGETLQNNSGTLSLTGWNLTLDPDPTVTGFIALQNNTAAPQIYALTFLTPVVPQGPQVQITGSVQGGVTDADGLGSAGVYANLADAGSPIYRASIDGVYVQSLLSPSQSASVTTPFGSASLGSANFGPTTLAQTANSNIGITLTFTLSPGDIASFTSVFNVVAVPEPGTLLMLGGGLAGLLVFNRRYARA